MRRHRLRQIFTGVYRHFSNLLTLDEGFPGRRAKRRKDPSRLQIELLFMVLQQAFQVYDSIPKAVWDRANPADLFFRKIGRGWL